MTVSRGETQPLLGSRPTFSAVSAINTAGGPRATNETDGRIVNGCVVDFDPNGDVDNPLEWPIAYKWGIVALMALMAFTVTFTCISVVPLAADIGRDLSGSEHPSKSASVLLVTIWELGEAAGPLLIAPLSEIFGRYPVTNGANMLFVAATVMAATSQSVPVFVAARALTGLAVASNVLNPAIVGDMFPTEQRGGALSLVFLAPLIGGALGPAIASAVAERAGWRRVIWMSAALVSVCEVLFLTLFRETYKVAILRRRAKALGVKTALEGEVDEHKGLRGLRDAVLRPAIVLFGSGVLAAMSLFGSICFSFYYIMSVTLSDILREVYHLSPVSAGLCFMSFIAKGFGSTFTVFVCNTYLDKIYIKMGRTNKGAGLPEYRLPLAIVGAFTMPLATLAYGWIAEFQLPLPFMLLSISLLGTTLMLSMIPLMSYVVDAFGLFSASAMTGVIVMRCLAGTFLPLATGPLVDSFGYGWGFTVFAALALCIAPIPIVIFRYGEKWRQYSKYSRA
ncbi:major facilitator superfamily domain-containing protein [Lasiosphaeris hirsuta]|uniref:Major facilitator superfamily domain-containing protein n=1 Tax=Lasiosphaeris hirsuta TaxID=260670 RepID=A0AA39ZVN9_9PEZI|nr:major facilitator superfamily domain-containing protein [Lasiosphaeris hirsuta]